MPAPKNRFKERLKAGETQIGCWLGMAQPYVAEMAADTGFDVLVIDAEHAPVDIGSLMGQLQAMATSDVQPLVRLLVGETHLIKQALDIGAQNLMIPMIESRQHAEAMSRAMYYPPRGIRGVGAGIARASRFSAIADYQSSADDEVCLFLQVESRKGIEALDEILSVDGVDGIFIGPGDLAADMGFAANPAAPEFRQTIIDTIKKIHTGGKAAGILAVDDNLARTCIDMGVEFVATDVDVPLFIGAMKAAAARFKPGGKTRPDKPVKNPY